MSLASDLIDAAPGVIHEYSGINLPAGYLWANGQQVSRTTYARLFAALTVAITGTTTSGNNSVTSVSKDLTQLPVSVVGMPVSGTGIATGTTISGVTATTITLSQNATGSASGVALTIAPYGVGDGSTTFNVPDRRGRAGVGHDLMGTSAAGRVTTAGGGVNGTLLGHGAGADTHTLTAAEIPAHTHPLKYSTQTYTSGAGTMVATVGSGGLSANTDSAGTGGAHSIMQPSIVMNYIIKT